MSTRRSFIAQALCASLSGCGMQSMLEDFRHGFAARQPELERAAFREARLRIDTTAHADEFNTVLTAFKALYPQIALDYRDPASNLLYTNFLADAASHRGTADLLISSAMDLQFKLVNDGYAQSYASPHQASLDAGTVWNDQAYAITAEPIVFAYNRRLVPPQDVPGSHEELADLLNRKRDQYLGRIATYDAERSGSGYLYYTQDLMLSRDTTNLAAAMGRAQPKLYISAMEANSKLSSGEVLLAYNMVSSYMLARQAHDPNTAIVFPSDYTLVMSRIAFIPKQAPHPAAGKLFLDFLLSRPGQQLLTRSYIQPVRKDVAVSWVGPSPELLRPIHFGPALLANLDELRRRRVLRDWRRTFAA